MRASVDAKERGCHGHLPRDADAVFEATATGDFQPRTPTMNT